MRSGGTIQKACGPPDWPVEAAGKVEGGATAAELVRRMGWRRLEVVGELAPGVAVLAGNPAPPLALTIKPRSYRWPKGLRVTGPSPRRQRRSPTGIAEPVLHPRLNKPS